MKMSEAYVDGYRKRLAKQPHHDWNLLATDPDLEATSDWINGWMDADDDIAFGLVR